MPTWDAAERACTLGPEILSWAKTACLKENDSPPVIKKKECVLPTQHGWKGSKAVTVRQSSSNKRHCNRRQWEYIFLGRRLKIKDSCGTGEKQDEPEAVV